MNPDLTFIPLNAHPLPALEDEEVKINEYRRLLGTLPTVNRATLKALINHLFRYSTSPSPYGAPPHPPWGPHPLAHIPNE